MDAIATACFVFEDGCTFFIKNGDENMGNLMTSFNAGVSGLHSAQQSLTVTSHNLANAGTVGYTRQQVLVTDSFYQKSYGVHDNVMAVGTGTTISLTRQVRNTFARSINWDAIITSWSLYTISSAWVAKELNAPQRSVMLL